MDDITQNKEITLAIYPFENLTEGNGLDVFCKAFHMDLVTELSRFRQFRLVYLQAFGEVKIPDADYTIKGSFHHHSEYLKINAQLIDNRDHRVAWADKFEGSRESLFSIQEDLLKEIVATLQQQLDYDLLTHIRKKAKVHLTAYENWLYGMEELKKGTPQADEKARIHFQQAIEIDPAYSLACSGMSMTYFNEWSCQLWDRWDVSRKGAFEWALKAIELDEQNCVAACVLGRVYLYEGKYETAEHYLRTALRLNPNDIDNLVQIASCFVFLGYVDEAEQLYLKVLQLNPLRSGSYHHIGAFIAFEKGEFEKCVSLGANARTPWVDFPGLMAAAYYALGDEENMRRSWQSFMNDYRTRIARSDEGNDAQALQWILNINPYRGKSNLLPFAEYITGNKGAIAQRQSARQTTYGESRAQKENYFMKENGRWQICFEGRLIHLTEVKGFFDLVKLLGHPERTFHCAELAGGAVIMKGEAVFDEKAKRAYHTRIRELQEEICTAGRDNDTYRSASLQNEYDQLVEHLTTSLGMGRKVRLSNDPLDKMRSAVTWRIRHAIRKIQDADPSLGKHLSLSIKTGLFCSYNPEKPLRWATMPGS